MPQLSREGRVFSLNEIIGFPIGELPSWNPTPPTYRVSNILAFARELRRSKIKEVEIPQPDLPGFLYPGHTVALARVLSRSKMGQISLSWNPTTNLDLRFRRTNLSFSITKKRSMLSYHFAGGQHATEVREKNWNWLWRVWSEHVLEDIQIWQSRQRQGHGGKNLDWIGGEEGRLPTFLELGHIIVAKIDRSFTEEIFQY